MVLPVVPVKDTGKGAGPGVKVWANAPTDVAAMSNMIKNAIHTARVLQAETDSPAQVAEGLTIVNGDVMVRLDFWVMWVRI